MGLAKVEEAKLITVSISDIAAVKHIRNTRARLAVACRTKRDSFVIKGISAFARAAWERDHRAIANAWCITVKRLTDSNLWLADVLTNHCKTANINKNFCVE